jgi:HAD superfamily hydrolase (TIGR01662 family)
MLNVVLFDLGNTLIYFDSTWPEVTAQSDQALYSFLVQSGYKLDEAFPLIYDQRMDRYYQERETEFIEFTAEMFLRDLMKEFGYDQVPGDIIKNAVAAQFGVSQAHWLPEVDALPLLEQLKDEGYHLGLISNANDARDVRVLIDKGNFAPYFDITLISAEVGLRKPHPGIFKIALDHFNARPEEAVMVGDTLGADILGANNLGISSVWISRRAEVRSDNLSHEDTIQPKATISALSELPGLLHAWGNPSGIH